MTATKRKPKPITAHPLFPVVTALWFGAFFGLGSFAVAPSLLEGPVVALGIPAIVPAAAPPLGLTARVMLALAMLLLGALTGYLVGRKLAPKNVVAPRRRSVADVQKREAAADVRDEPRRPLNPAEELGEPLTAFAQPEPAPSRRRALSLTDEGQLMMPSEDAPLPGYLPWETPAEAAIPDTEVEDPLALQGLFQAAENAAVAAPFAAPFAPPAEEPAPFMTSAELPSEPSADDSFAGPAGEEPAAPVAAAKPLLQAPAGRVTPLDRAPLEGLGLVQLVERLATAIARHAPAAREAAALETSAFAPAAVVREAAAPAEPVAHAPAAFVEAPQELQRVVPLRPFAVEVAPDVQDDEPVEQVAELARFLRAPKNVDQVNGPAPTADGAEGEVAEDCYPSLLDMGPVPSRIQASRIEDGLGLDTDSGNDGIEPSVVFPGQASALQAGLRRFERPSILPVQGSPMAAPGRAAPSSPLEPLPGAPGSSDPSSAEAGSAPSSLPDPEEADRALRAALATLQRMTAQG